MFDINLVSLVIGIVLGVAFPTFFKFVWDKIKESSVYSKIVGLFNK